MLLARALCQEPEILVLDEPTSFLDIRYKIELLSILLEEARERRLTVILSLHEIDLAEKISDLILCVKGDTVWRYGLPREIFRDVARMRDLHLDVPRMTALAAELRAAGMPVREDLLTVEEMVEEVKRLCPLKSAT